MSLSVIIPSRNIENLKACVEAVTLHEPGAQLIVIWDGSGGVRKASSLEELWDVQRIMDRFGGMVMNGGRPFIFARNCNIGIEASGPDTDVILLNDDALLQSSGGFSIMRAALDVHEKLGIVAATTNVCMTPFQHEGTSGGVRLAQPFGPHRFPVVSFVCVLIPRRTIAAVGLLDERYTAYGWEDVDYCRRVHDAGLLVGIDDRCFVDHARLMSTFRGDPHAAGPIDEGRRIYFEKWGTS